MLSESERTEILAEVGRCERRRAAVSEALMIVQRHRGWVSDEGVRDVADVLGMTAEEVDSVATLFELVFRRPVGRHVVLLCDSVSCWITGSDGIRDHVLGRLGIGFGQTTSDGLFTVLPAGCLGACDMAPAMMVDGELFGNLSPEGVDAVLERVRFGAPASPVAARGGGDG